MREDQSVTKEHSSDDEQIRLAHAHQLLASMQDQIRAADAKINVLFSASTLLAAALALTNQQTLGLVRSDGLSALELAAIGARVLVLAAVAAAVTCAIFALLPRVRSANVERSLVFFGHIAAGPHDSFVDEVRGLAPEVLERQILSQVYVNAQIVTTKYTWTRRAAAAFLLAVGMLIFTQSLGLFA